MMNRLMTIGGAAGTAAGMAALAMLASMAAATAQGLEVVGHAENWQMGFQEPVTEVMREINDFHNVLLVLTTAIAVFVLVLLIYVVWRFRAAANPKPSRFTHNALIEVIWVTVPIIIVLGIIFPSWDLLYLEETVPDPEVQVSVTGHSWHWSYEFPDQQVDEFFSYIKDEEDLGEDDYRLLSTYEPLVLPIDTNIEFLVTAEGVLHSFAVPAFGIRIDAVPGRTNSTWARIEREGIYFGQCSELCGQNHAYMPIEVHALSREAWDAWVLAQIGVVDPENPPLLLTGTVAEVQARRRLALAD